MRIQSCIRLKIKVNISVFLHLRSQYRTGTERHLKMNTQKKTIPRFRVQPLFSVICSYSFVKQYPSSISVSCLAEHKPLRCPYKFFFKAFHLCACKNQLQFMLYPSHDSFFQYFAPASFFLPVIFPMCFSIKPRRIPGSILK